MTTNQLPPLFIHTPLQSLGGHWHLAGWLKRPEIHGTLELVLVRKIDALSPQISVAKACQYVIPKLTVTTPSGGQVHLQNARATEVTETYELERIDFTFQKIDGTSNEGGITGADSWQNISGGSGGGHKRKK